MGSYQGCQDSTCQAALAGPRRFRSTWCSQEAEFQHGQASVKMQRLVESTKVCSSNFQHRPVRTMFREKVAKDMGTADLCSDKILYCRAPTTRVKNAAAHQDRESLHVQTPAPRGTDNLEKRQQQTRVRDTLLKKTSEPIYPTVNWHMGWHGARSHWHGARCSSCRTGAFAPAKE